MKISLLEQGGWSAGATPREQIVDLNAIDEESSREGRALVEKLRANTPAPQSENPQARDDMEFTITIEDETQASVFTAKSLALTREFADLLSWIKRRLAEQRGRPAKES